MEGPTVNYLLVGRETRGKGQKQKSQGRWKQKESELSREGGERWKGGETKKSNWKPIQKGGSNVLTSGNDGKGAERRCESADKVKKGGPQEGGAKGSKQRIYTTVDLLLCDSGLTGNTVDVIMGVRGKEKKSRWINIERRTYQGISEGRTAPLMRHDQKVR